jgi:hypothetical protein
MSAKWLSSAITSERSASGSPPFKHVVVTLSSIRNDLLKRLLCIYRTATGPKENLGAAQPGRNRPESVRVHPDHGEGPRKNGSAKFSKDRNKIAALKGHRYRRGVREPRDDGILPCACD